MGGYVNSWRGYSGRTGLTDFLERDGGWRFWIWRFCPGTTVNLENYAISKNKCDFDLGVSPRGEVLIRRVTL